MSPFRRRVPLHERLLAAGGLLGGPASEPGHPFRDLVGVHGVPRAREWDAVVTAETDGLEGRDELSFAALPDGSLVVEEDVPDGALEPLAAAVESELRPPYSAQAVRRAERLWAVGARAIEVAELPDAGGDEVELVVQGGTRTLTVDGARAFGTVAALERLAGARHPEFVAHATRLDGDVFEIGVAPL